MEFITCTSTIADGNMSFKHGPADEVLQNRQRFIKKLRCEPSGCVMMNSDHKDIVTVVGSETGTNHFGLQSSIIADALITQDPDITLLLLTADCLPIALHDEATNTIGLIHLSRHTFCLALLEKTFLALRKLGSAPDDVVVEIGPHIHQESYVFPLPLQEEPTKLKQYIEKENDQAYIDLTRAATETLIDLGVRSNKITVSPIDTCKHENYFSHVRSMKIGEPEGRIVTAVWFKTV